MYYSAKIQKFYVSAQKMIITNPKFMLLKLDRKYHILEQFLNIHVVTLNQKIMFRDFYQYSEGIHNLISQEFYLFKLQQDQNHDSNILSIFMQFKIFDYSVFSMIIFIFMNLRSLNLENMYKINILINKFLTINKAKSNFKHDMTS